MWWQKTLFFLMLIGLSASGVEDPLAALAKSCQPGATNSATYQTHTRGAAPQEESAEFKTWIGDPAHWTPERNAAHDRLASEYLERVKGLSEALSQSPKARALGKPILLLTRGNSGSGKSYMLKNPDHPLLEQLDLPRLMGDQRFEEAPINPDVLKHQIQNELEGGRVSNGAVHEEGSMLADRIMEQAFAEGLSFVVDKRFGKASQVDKLAARAKKAGYHVIVVDVDAPLSVSTSRVTDRPVGGESPNVQFEPIRSGYVEAREHRAAVAALKSVDEYLVFSSTPHNPETNGLVASRSGEGPVVPAKPEAWKALTQVQDSELRYADHLYSEILDLLARTNPKEFARVLGKEPRNLPAASSFNIPPHTYLVLPGDRAILKQVSEGKHATFHVGDRLTVKLGRFTKSGTYEVVDVGDRVTLKNEATGKKTQIDYEKLLDLPREAHISDAELQDYANTRGGSALYRLRDDRYDLVKYQDFEYHDKMAYAIRDYLTRTIPGIDVVMEPAGDRVRILIHGTDAPTKARLVSDRNWAVKLVAGSNPESPALLIDTKDIERQNYPMIFPRPDRGIGYNGVNPHTPGSAGHEFVTYGSQLDLLADIAGREGRRIFPDAPLLFQVARGKVGFVFSSWAENGKYFHGGFRSDQGVAFHHSARVHLHEAKKLQGKAKQDAIIEASAALQASHLADEFLGYTAYALSNRDHQQVPVHVAGARPTAMNRQLGGPLTLQFHDSQLAYRAKQGGGSLETELSQAEAWFENKIAANRLVREEARQLLEGLGAKEEIGRLEAQWKSAQRYPDASALAE